MHADDRSSSVPEDKNQDPVPVAGAEYERGHLAGNPVKILVTRVARDGSWAEVRCGPTLSGRSWTERQQLPFPPAFRLVSAVPERASSIPAHRGEMVVLRRIAKRLPRCAECGDRFHRSRTFRDTVRPGRTVEDVWVELGRQADLWQPYEKCTRCSSRER
jgi:hypothetical protein